MTITTDILRKPKSHVYASEKSNPVTYFFGYASFFIGDYCTHKVAIEFTEQVILQVDNLYLALFALEGCDTALMTNNLVSHRISIPLAGGLIPVDNPVPTFPGITFSKIKFLLPDGCRIKVTAVGEELNLCEDFKPPITLPVLPDLTEPYPKNRDRSLDPARSTGYIDDFPGDTAIATSEDPDLGYDARRCFKVTGTSATTFQQPGSYLQSSGTSYPSYVKAVTVTQNVSLVQGGYYDGMYGYFLYIDGIYAGLSASQILILPNQDMSLCPN